MRVVSLLPSATDVVYALGREDDLVGVTFECDERARAAKQVVVGGLDTHGLTPGEIDALVRQRLAAGEDLYTLHADALAALAPDVILTQDLCRVCALPSGHVTEALDLLGCSADVVSLDPHSLADVLDDIAVLARAIGVEDVATALLAELHGRLDAVGSAVLGRPRPTVAVIEWTDPPFAAGHWVPDLVTAAGGVPVTGNRGGRSVPMTWEVVRAAEPDLVLVAPCGFGLDAAVAQARSALPELTGLPVWAIDADAFVVRPGPRLIDGIEAIAHVLHPEAVPAPPPGRVARVG